MEVLSDGQTPLRHEQYNVGWICALWIEMAAAQAMLDQVHASLPTTDDTNNYILGSIVSHNIVIACLPSGHYGTNNAAIVASNMRRTFPNITNVFLVGIGGGVPDFADVRLGDVVVSHEVLQYDLGKTGAGGEFHHTAIPVKPPQNLLTAVSKLRAHHEVESTQVPSILSDMLSRHPNMSRYARPNLQDFLFCPSFIHAESEVSCNACMNGKTIERKPRRDTNPVMHYGRIASGNQVLKDGKVRALLARRLGVLCFEMEAAGLMDQFPCLVIRGICDYSDSHKNKQWQEYAAAAAAAYTKELLLLTSVIKNEIANIHNRRRVLLRSLGFEEVESRRANIKAAHKKTCEWILDHPKYLAWQDDDKFSEHYGLLWIGGKPGAGKSTIMKHIYTRACGNDISTANPAVLSFFFHARGVELERSIMGMFRSLLLQLLTRFPDLQEVLDKIALAKTKEENPTWKIEELQHLFSSALMKLGQRSLVCFIDALDECDEEEVQDVVDYFESVGDLAVEENLRLKICSSSRHYPYLHVTKGIKLILEDQCGHKDDMLNYVKSKLRAGKGKASENIVEEILSKASGVFMWVVLAVDILNKEFQRGRIFAVKQRLKELPPKLSDMFSDIISRDAENMDDFLLCIQWLLHAERPLNSHEFYLALVSGLDPSPENLGPWDEDRITDDDIERFVLSASKGLAEIVKAEANVVQFIHESVRDFFLKDDGIRRLWPNKAVDFTCVSNDRLKSCCQNYLETNVFDFMSESSSQLRKYSKEADELYNAAITRFPFLEYATANIFRHSSHAAREISQYEFLRKLNRTNWIKLNNVCELGDEDFDRACYAQNASLALILTEYPCEELVETAIEYEVTAVVEKWQYICAAFIAVQEDNTRIAKALLATSGLDLNLRNNAGETILLFAILHGNESIVEHLISDNTLDIEATDNGGMTALCHAAKKGHERIVKLILDTGKVNVNVKNKGGKTPYELAKIGGHDHVADLLFKARETQKTSMQDGPAEHN